MSIHIPPNLVPLPTMPWDTRPTDLPLTREEARTAIWLEEGNITKAALRLKVDSVRLRRYVKNDPYLSAQMEEAREQIKDRAEEVIVEALNDPEDVVRRDAAAKFVLTNLAGDRGYGGNKKPGVVINNNGSGAIVVQWGDGTALTGSEDGDDGSVIEHEAAE